MIFANTNIQAGVMNGSPLPYDDASRFGKLSAIDFYA